MTFGHGDYGGIIPDAAVDIAANGRPLANVFYQLEFAQFLELQMDSSRC